MNYDSNLKMISDALGYIPADDYNVYRDIVAALKHEMIAGKINAEDAYTLARSWAATSTKFEQKEFDYKWKSFKDTYTGDLIGAGSIIETAKKYGYEVIRPTIEPLHVGSTIDLSDLSQNGIVASKAISSKYPLDESKQARQIMQFLDLYQDNDRINIVVDAMQKGEKWIPTGRGITRSVEEWRDIIQKGFASGKGPFAFFHSETLPDGRQCSYNPQAGVWVRINPLDGQGVNDGNVTAFKYALIESDSLDKAKQLALIKQLGCVVMAVDSGKKSIHGIVKIEASSLRDYRNKVEALQKDCTEAGLEVDPNTKNPSRLMRLPGIQRGGNWQRIVWQPDPADIVTYSEWRAMAAIGQPIDIMDDWDTFDPVRECKPVLIDGILRKGHKFTIGGPSKSGKSVMASSLATAVASGTKWMDIFQCKKGRVLYINGEIDPPSFKKRIHTTANAYGIRRFDEGYLEIWNLRGRLVDAETLVSMICKWAKGKDPALIIIDPIYKLTCYQDENSAADIAKMCNLFDRITTETGAAVAICHHFSKGTKAGTAVIDRMSGSGVFARDPDGLMTCTPLDWTPGPDHPNRVALRLEFSLREFPTPAPINIFFDYPKHIPDYNNILMDTSIQGDPRTKKKKGGEARGLQKKDEAKTSKQALEKFLYEHIGTKCGQCEMVDGMRAIKFDSVMKITGLSKTTLWRYLKNMEPYEMQDGYILNPLPVNKMTPTTL